jgi:hypothetical protein
MSYKHNTVDFRIFCLLVDLECFSKIVEVVTRFVLKGRGFIRP